MAQAASLVRDLVARFARHGAALPETPPATDAERVGRRDAELGGWFRDAEGILVTGLPVGRADTVFVEGDADVAAFCRRHAGRVIAANLERTPLAGGLSSNDGADLDAVRHKSVSLICSFDRLQLAPERALAALLRIGRPGARYLLAVPDPVQERLHGQGLPHAIERDAFEALVKASGLVIEARRFDGFFWAMHGALRQACVPDPSAPSHPALDHWVATWDAALSAPQGPRLKRLMDDFMPQRQLILARKP